MKIADAIDSVTLRKTVQDNIEVGAQLKAMAMDLTTFSANPDPDPAINICLSLLTIRMLLTCYTGCTSAFRMPELLLTTPFMDLGRNTFKDILMSFATVLTGGSGRLSYLIDCLMPVVARILLPIPNLHMLH